MLLAGREDDFHFEHGGALTEGCWILEDMDESLKEFGGDSFDEDRIIGEILTVLDLAVAGSLYFSANPTSKRGVGEVMRNKNLLELRLPRPIPYARKQLRGRMYICEPIATLYDGIVALLFHVKQDGNDELNALQDGFIDEAAERLPDTMYRLSRP